VVVLGAIGAFLVSIATAGGLVWTIRYQREQLELARAEADSNRLRADEAAEALDRSTSFTELEKALPGLGLLVDRWQKEAADEYRLRIAAQEKAMADHQMILDLQDEVNRLKAQLAASQAKNVELERRVADLEAERDSR
jgi:hypothetical protein